MKQVMEKGMGCLGGIGVMLVPALIFCAIFGGIGYLIAGVDGFWHGVKLFFGMMAFVILLPVYRAWRGK